MRLCHVFKLSGVVCILGQANWQPGQQTQSNPQQGYQQHSNIQRAPLQHGHLSAPQAGQAPLAQVGLSSTSRCFRLQNAPIDHALTCLLSSQGSLMALPDCNCGECAHFTS